VTRAADELVYGWTEDPIYVGHLIRETKLDRRSRSDCPSAKRRKDEADPEAEASSPQVALG
jgi:hypothetical protein